MSTPATLDDLFPSKYLKASDIQGEPVYTIASLATEKLKNNETKQDEEKTILYFQEVDKGIVLNKTNANTIAGLYGNTLADWIGKRVILWTPMVEGFGKTAPAIRVKDQKPPVDHKVALQHYAALYERAKAAKVENVEDWAISADLPTEEILETGKRLKEAIEAAELFS